MDKSFKEILVEAIESHGANLSKLAESSRVPERYLELLIREEFDKLPAAPYLHGYIHRLAVTLELDSDLLWEIFKKEYRLKTSGGDDRLPANRFAIQTVNNTKLLIIGLLAIIVVAYLIIRWSALFGRPALAILDPVNETTIASVTTYTIRGSTGPDIKVSINNDLLDVSSDGTFSKDVLLQSGINTFEIKAKKLLGREVSVIRQIILQSDSSPSPSSINPPAPTLIPETIPEDSNATSADQ